jgi:hypothetical protein
MGSSASEPYAFGDPLNQKDQTVHVCFQVSKALMRSVRAVLIRVTAGAAHSTGLKVARTPLPSNFCRSVCGIMQRPKVAEMPLFSWPLRRVGRM